MIHHPAWTGWTRRLGTVAGYTVYALELPGTAHPDHPRPLSDVGGYQRWVKVGAAPWTRTDRGVPVVRWLDAPDAPWSLEDLPAVLSEMQLPEIADGDWPAGCSASDCWRGSHYTVHLPAAHRAAAERYAALILGTAP